MDDSVSNAGTAGRDPEFDLHAFFPYLVRLYYRAVSSAVAEVYETKYDLTVHEWRVMAVLGPHGALAATDIVAYSSLDKVTISRAISRLRGRGYLKRDIDGDDRRRSVLRLNQKGREVFLDLVPRVLDVERKLLRGLSQEERQTLFLLMQRVRSNAE